MNKKNVALYVLLIIIFLYLVFEVSNYFCVQKNNEKLVSYCSVNETKECYHKMFERILPELLVNDVFAEDKALSLVKLDKTPVFNTSYVYKKSSEFVYFFDKSLHSPITHTIYEDKIEEKFKLNVFSFSYDSEKQKNDKLSEMFDFFNYCRETGRSVALKIDVRTLNNKLINEILEYSDVINGLLIILHLEQQSDIIESKNVLKLINNKYVLTSRNSDYGDAGSLHLNPRNLYKAKKIIPTKYYRGVLYDSTLILSYVNKNIVDKYNISLLQNTENLYTGKKVNGHRSFYAVEKSDVHWAVTITEKFRQLLKK